MASLSSTENHLHPQHDGADPHTVDEIRHKAERVSQANGVTEALVGAIALYAEFNIAVEAQMTIAHAAEVHHQLVYRLDYLLLVVIHVDPADQSGEAHHRI